MNSFDRRLVVTTLLVIIVGGSALAIGFVSRVTSDTWQTDCYVDFEVSNAAAARAFAADMEDRGYEPQVSNPTGAPKRMNVTVVSGGLFGDGSEVKGEVLGALKGVDGGKLEGGSCLGHPMFD